MMTTQRVYLFIALVRPLLLVPATVTANGFGLLLCGHAALPSGHRPA